MWCTPLGQLNLYLAFMVYLNSNKDSISEGVHQGISTTDAGELKAELASTAITITEQRADA